MACRDDEPHELDVALGRRIRLRRRSLGMSQATLADKTGVTFQQIQKYERGSTRVSFSRLVDIAHGLECRVLDLVGDLDDASLERPQFSQDTNHLLVAGASELLAAYAATPPSLRRAVLKMVLGIARNQRADPEEAEDLAD